MQIHSRINKLVYLLVGKTAANLFKILLFLFSIYAVPQAQIQNARFEHLTINDGLSQGSIKCILRDHRGFMWFGTQDGLNRYDGYSFKVYRHEIGDSSSISSNNIPCMAEDLNGDLWIGTSNGLNKFDRKQNRFIRFNTSKFFQGEKYSDWINSIWVSRTTDYVWFSTNGGLFRLNKKTFEIKKYFPPYTENSRDDYVLVIFAYDEDRLFLGTINGDAFEFNPQKNVFTKINFKFRRYSNSLRAVSSFAKDKNNNLWIGTHDGLFKYELVTKKVEAYYEDPSNTNSLMGNLVTALAIKDDILWIAASDFGLDRFDIKTKVFTSFKNDKSNPFSLNLNVLMSLYMDPNGILWVGTSGSGIDKYNPFLNNFILYTQRENGLSIKSIRSFYEDRKDNLWVGGYGGINKINKQRNHYTYFTDSPKSKFGLTNAAVYTIAEDKDNPEKVLWVGTEGSGINMLDMETNLVYKNPLGDFWDKNEIGQGIYSILDDGEGNLWIGNNKGLDVINKKSRAWRHFEYNASDPTSISPQAVTVIYEDKDRQFWIGTDMGGICLVDRKNFKFKRYSFDPANPYSLSNNFIKCIYQDSKNRHWIGTNGGGLNLFDISTGKFKRVTTKDGLPNDVVYGIVEDEKGNLWLSTNHGICKYNPDKNSFTDYDVRDGLQSNEFNTNAYYRGNNGDIYFGGINGFNVISSRNFNINKNPPNVVFTNFELFNRKINIDEKVGGRILLKHSIENTKTIKLNYDENVFSIEFAALDFTSPLKNKYSYYMQGFDKGWTEPSEYRKVTYTNLHPGEYIFKVKGTNNDGVWSTKPAELKIIVVPPFWQTWWFIVISSFLLFAVLFAFYLLRINAIKKQKVVLENEVNARTSDLAELNKELLKSGNELKESNESKDKFFSILAHDLRGPFAGAIGLSEILVEDIDEMDKMEIKELSYDINQILHEQFVLLENLLDWSRIQQNKYQYEPERIDLSEITDRVYRFMLNNAKAKNVNLDVDVPDNIFVTGNSTMLHSVLQNLISNSIKFTNEGGTVKISVIKKVLFAQVIVEDNGIGMDSDTLQNLFKADIIKSTDGTAKEKGSGLGLLLVKEFATRMGGEVHVESELSKGSKFSVKIPLNKS